MTNGASDNSAQPPMTHTIVLPAPNDTELGSMKEGKKDEPLQVGFGREVPANQRRIPLADLSWKSQSSGGYAASVSVESTGARSLRVALKLSQDVSGLEFVFGASGATVPAATIAKDLYWTPVTPGDTVAIELRALQRPSSGILEIRTVSHIP